jgi:DNA-binding transcriptional MerR regulator
VSTSAALPELTGLDDHDLLIGDVARLSGLSIDTLHYYDRAGLLGAVHRDGGGRRVFDRDALDLLDVVLRLRRTGMPVKEVRHFVDLVGSGDAERAGRLAIDAGVTLNRHCARLRRRALRAGHRTGTGRAASRGARAVAVATKFGLRIDEERRTGGGTDVRPEAIRNECQASLRLLGVDGISISCTAVPTPWPQPKTW